MTRPDAGSMRHSRAWAPAAKAAADEPPGEGLLLGHALAAGWLATELWASGVVGAPGSFAPTVAAVVGAP